MVVMDYFSAFAGVVIFLVALLGIEFDTVGDWARRREMPYTTYADLASKPEVVALIGEWVDHVNRDLARVEREAEDTGGVVLGDERPPHY